MRIKNKQFWKAAIVTAVLAAWVSIPLVTNSAKADSLVSDIERWAQLTSPDGQPNPNGIVEWKLDNNNRKEIEFNLYGLSQAPGTTLTAVVNGNVIGTFSVGSFQHAELRLRTQDGQSVPDVVAGTATEVRDGSTVVANGVFANGPAPSPSPSGSPSGSPTGSPSGSPSASPTGSPSGSPSPSPSVSPSASPSPSPTGSPNGTPSPSPTGSPNGTPSPSPSASPSPSPTGSPNGTPSPSPSPSASPNSGDLFAGLSGPTLNGVVPTGYAQFEIHSSRIELEVRLRQINLNIGSSLAVIVDGVPVGNMTIESGGEARLRLRSDDNEYVPPVVSGSTIAINYNNSAILTGLFSGGGPSPSPSPSGSPSPSPTGSPNGTPSPSPSPSFGRSFEAHLTGGQIDPPVTTAANGEIKITLSVDETQATIFGEFHNLSGNQTGARIETSVGSIATIRDLGIVGGINGNFASATFAVTPAQVQQLRAGLWSAVIMSVNNPAGEIRGRLIPRSSLSDLDGDGRNDFAVFRPSTGTWYWDNSNGTSVENFGFAGDQVVSGDYDGDGRTDVAVYRNVSGQGVWQIKRSSDGGVSTASFGLATDIPVRGDFDGDGRLDLAVYRASQGTWYIQKSNNTGVIVIQFGIASDKPMPADMDGDGKDDIAVYRPAEGDWYWLRSSDGQFGGIHWGQNGDVPALGDFDGDGKADVTVYRQSTGIWYTLRSSDAEFQATYFGIGGDIPVAGHFDNDGKLDIAVFRPSDGNWYVLRSSDGSFQTFHFGLEGDVPLNAR